MSKLNTRCPKCAYLTANCLCDAKMPASKRRKSAVDRWSQTVLEETAPKGKKPSKAPKASESNAVTGTVAKVLCHADGRAWVTLTVEGEPMLLNASVMQAMAVLEKLGKKVTVDVSTVGMRHTLA